MVVDIFADACCFDEKEIKRKSFASNGKFYEDEAMKEKNFTIHSLDEGKSYNTLTFHVIKLWGYCGESR